MKKLVTLIQKECFENRGSVLWIPLSIGLLMMIITMGSLIWHGDVAIQLNDGGINAISQLDLATRHQIATALLAGLSIPFFLTLSFVVIFFLAHALFDERKDRSILFWKSLPVSDQLTVSAKLLMALLIMPLSYWCMVVVTQIVVLSSISIVGFSEGVNLFSSLWQPGLILGQAFSLLTALLIHGLWMLPIYAWLLFCSSWAPRSPLMIAIAIVAIASLGLSTWQIASTGRLWHEFEPLVWLQERIAQSPLPLNFQLTLDLEVTLSQQSTTFVEMLAYLGSGPMWLGVMMALPLLGGAVYMRRRATA